VSLFSPSGAVSLIHHLIGSSQKIRKRYQKGVDI